MFSNFNLFGGPFERQPTTSSVQLFISTLNCIQRGVWFGDDQNHEPSNTSLGVPTLQNQLDGMPFGSSIHWAKRQKKRFFFVVVLCVMYGSKFLNQKKREQQFVAKIINNDDDDNAMCRFLYFRIRLMFFSCENEIFLSSKISPTTEKKMNSIPGIMCMKIEKDSLVVHLSK